MNLQKHAEQPARRARGLGRAALQDLRRASHVAQRYLPKIPRTGQNPKSEPESGLNQPIGSIPEPPRSETEQEGEERMATVERAVGQPFINRRLLRDALTHRSFLNETSERRPSNERLEFLGDAVLGALVADYLYQRYPDITEGELTNLRSALVRTDTLARFADELKLGDNLFLGRGEEMSRGRFRPTGLACAFEALLGSIYLDRGYESARSFALRFIEPTLEHVVSRQLHRNAKSTLQEALQATHQTAPTYHLVRETGPDHAKHFTVEVRINGDVLGRGEANNKRAAEQLAAADALEGLGR